MTGRPKNIILNMKWFKFYGQDWLCDPKIISLGIEDRLCFITLLILANNDEHKGIIKHCTEEMVIRLTQLQDNPYDDDNEYERATGCFARFIHNEMIQVDEKGNVLVINFLKRQEQNLTPAEKQHRYREKQDKVTSVTQPKVTNVTLDKNRIDKKRKELNTNTSLNKLREKLGDKFKIKK
jgi:hypothetical protein